MAQSITNLYVAPNGQLVAEYSNGIVDDLGIFIGTPGVDGANGAPGADGADGLDGMPGPQGVKGDTGTAGAQRITVSSEPPSGGEDGDIWIVVPL